MRSRSSPNRGPAFNGSPVAGMTPVVNMGTLEDLLTGRDFDSIMRSGGSPGEDVDAPEVHGVITLTESLRTPWQKLTTRGWPRSLSPGAGRKNWSSPAGRT